MNRVLVVVMAVAAAAGLSAREPKEHDADVNYDENRLPHYDLPPLLVTATTKTIYPSINTCCWL